jgi:hypothetical protein
MTRSLRVLAFAAVSIALCRVTDAGAGTMAGFGRCLKSKGATFYGASWCPHCRAQSATLGDALDYVKYVECSVDGGREQTAQCEKAKIDGYPTWTFGDGSRVSGEQSLAALAEKTGCELPRGARSSD